MITTILTREERLHFIEHQNHKIMWCDYSRSSEQEMIGLLEKAVILGRTTGNRLNILSNFKSTPKCPDFNKKLKAHGKFFHQEGIDVRVAILGIDSPLKRVVVNATMAITRIKNVKLFENKDDAMKWLIS
ncbi:hypothetical protein [Ekhidna sp.]|uniref:hypothetical protein n=1 Tax=Ekhidna sp. TaxID=2608089 RepID=UPI00329757CC